MQVHPIKPKLKPPGTKRLKLGYEELISNFAFKFNLRHYTMGFNRVHITQQVESSVARWKQARYRLPHTARHVIHRTLNPRFVT